MIAAGWERGGELLKAFPNFPETFLPGGPRAAGGRAVPESRSRAHAGADRARAAGPVSTRARWRGDRRSRPRERRVLDRRRPRRASQRVGRADLDELPRLPGVRANEGEPRESYIFLRGDYRARGVPVTPATPAFLPLPPADAAATRLGLAKWVVSRDNPLTARVAVNRFGRLLGRGHRPDVRQLRFPGEKPTHPELLDWLASDFMDHGWSGNALSEEWSCPQPTGSHRWPLLRCWPRMENRLLARNHDSACPRN